MPSISGEEAFAKENEKEGGRASAEVQDEQALHQYKLAKAVYNEQLKNEDEEEKYQELKIARELQQNLRSSHHRQQRQQGHHNHHHRHGHHHVGNHGHSTKEYETELAQKQSHKPVKNKDKTTKHQVVKKPAHVKKRHRITKKRFMRCIDYELMKSILAKAKLDQSLLLNDDFDASSLGMETFISTRQDMLKLEVIMEALKEGLIDKFGADSEDKNIHIPTEEELLAFENEKNSLLIKIREKEEEKVLEDARTKATDLDVGRNKAPAENQKIVQDLLKDTRAMLINAEQERQVKGDGTEDPYTKLVRNLQSSNTSEDEWTISTSTTTGSYKSWRRKEEEAEKKSSAVHKLRKPHWGDGSRHLFIRFIAGLIIFGYWVYYIKQRFTKLMHDIFSEQLQNHDVLSTRYVRKSLDGSLVSIKVYHWFHFIFTLIAPVIVVGNHTALGVFYGFSIMVHGLIFMFEIGYDQLFEPLPTWGIIIHKSANAALFSGMVVVFFIFHYVAHDPVKKSREFYHRKTSRINRVLYAKSLGTFEQRMLAWDWMINHARKREIKKLAKAYPQIAQANGHFPVPERKHVKFNLPKELRLFRVRHVFNDVTIRGGWINMEQYQDELFGSNESSSESDEDYLDPLAHAKPSNNEHTSMKMETGEKEELAMTDPFVREMFGEGGEVLVQNINDSRMSQQHQGTKGSGHETMELFKARKTINTNESDISKNENQKRNTGVAPLT